MNGQTATEPMETEPTETAQPGTTEESFFIPNDIINGRSYKPGDKLTLEVMGTDQDGDLEVCFPGSSGGDWKAELKSELTKAGE